MAAIWAFILRSAKPILISYELLDDLDRRVPGRPNCGVTPCWSNDRGNGQRGSELAHVIPPLSCLKVPVAVTVGRQRPRRGRWLEGLGAPVWSPPPRWITATAWLEIA
jgi:hypothetical protein